MKKTFSAHVLNLKKVLIFLREQTGAYLKRKDLMLVSVSVEEIFINIVKYGYTQPNGTVDISVNVDEPQRTVQIIIEDSGLPFNPLTRPDPDITVPIEKRKIGNLGIFITKKVMDQLEYTYADHKNILTLYKKY